MLRVNVADTPSKQEKGLMFVKDLPHDQGMLFQFPKPKKLAFWGVNTYIPLDIAFVDSNHKIVDIKEIQPFDQRAVACEKDCSIAIEANIDYFKDNNIAIGDTIDLVDDMFEGPCMKFRKVQKLAQTTDQITVDEAKGLPYDFPIDQHERQPMSSDQNNYYDDEFDESQGYQQMSEEDAILDEFGIEDAPLADDISGEMEMIDPNEYLAVDADDPTPEKPDQDYPQFATAQEALFWADKHNQAIWIDYTTLSGTNIQRNIEPHGIYSAKNGNQLVVTYDETVNAKRSFIINQINDFQFLGRTFKDQFIFTPPN